MNRRVSKLIRKISVIRGQKAKALKKAWNAMPHGTRSIAKLEEILYGVKV